MPQLQDGIRSLADLGPIRDLRIHLQTDPRYFRCGRYSFLLTVLIFCYGYIPLFYLDTNGGWAILLHPGIRTLEDFVILGGFALAAILGLIAVFQHSKVERALGVFGSIMSANYLISFLWGMSLFGFMGLIFELSIILLVGIPASLVYEMSGKNEPLAILILLVPPVVTWMLIRRRALRSFRARFGGWQKART